MLVMMAEMVSVKLPTSQAGQASQASQASQSSQQLTLYYKEGVVTSLLLNDLLSTYGEDYVFEVHSSYVDIFNVYLVYLDYINGQQTVLDALLEDEVSRNAITARLQAAFNLSLYLDDNSFFVYLMAYLLKHWLQSKFVVVDQ